MHIAVDGTFSMDRSLSMYSVLVSMQQKWLWLDLYPKRIIKIKN